MIPVANSDPPRAMRSTPFAGVEFHWIATCLFAALVVPLFFAAKLPLSVNWPRLLSIFWVGLSLHSVAFAVLLMVIGFPIHQTLGPVWTHYKAQKPRLVFFVIFAIIMILQFGLLSGFVLIVLAVVLGELVDRTRGDLNAIVNLIKPLLVPSVYLFLGLVMVFAYNDLIGIELNP